MPTNVNQCQPMSTASLTHPRFPPIPPTTAAQTPGFFPRPSFRGCGGGVGWKGPCCFWAFFLLGCFSSFLPMLVRRRRPFPPFPSPFPPPPPLFGFSTTPLRTCRGGQKISQKISKNKTVKDRSKIGQQSKVPQMIQVFVDWSRVEPVQ